MFKKINFHLAVTVIYIIMFLSEKQFYSLRCRKVLNNVGDDFLSVLDYIIVFFLSHIFIFLTKILLL